MVFDNRYDLVSNAIGDKETGVLRNIVNSNADPVRYGVVKSDSEVSKRAEIQAKVDRINEVPEVASFWDSQQNVDLTVDKIDSMVKQAKLIKNATSKIDFSKDNNTADIMAASFLHATASHDFGEAVVDNDYDAMVRARSVMANNPVGATEGVIDRTAAGLGGLAGSVASIAAPVAVAVAGLYAASKIGKTKDALIFLSKSKAGRKFLANEVVRKRVKGAATNIVMGGAVTYGVRKSEFGHAIHDLRKTRPELSESEVRNIASSVANINSAVEGFGVAIGMATPIFNVAKTAVTKSVIKGAVNPAVATSKAFWDRLSTGVAGTLLATGEELSEELMQNIVSEAAKDIDPNSENITFQLFSGALIETGKSAGRILTPFIDMTAADRQFVEDTRNMKYGLIAMHGVARLGFGENSLFSDGTPINQKGGLKAPPENIRENEQFVKGSKDLKVNSAEMGLDKFSNKQFNEVIERNGVGQPISVEVDDYLTLVDAVLANEELTSKDRADIEKTFEVFSGQVEFADRNGEKVEIPFGMYKDIFEPVEETFNQLQNTASLGQDSMSKKDMEERSKAMLSGAQSELDSSIDDDHVYSSVLASIEDDVKISDTDKLNISAAAQMMSISGASMFKDGGSTPAEFYNKYLSNIEIDPSRKGVSSLSKMIKGLLSKDKKGVDPRESAMKRSLHLESDVVVSRKIKEIKKSVKQSKKLSEINRSKAEKLLGKKVTTVMDIVRKVGISSGLTDVEVNNIKSIPVSKREKGALTNYLPEEVVNALGDNLARKHVRQGGLPLDKFGEVFKNAGFFDEYQDASDIPTEKILELISEGASNEITLPSEDMAAIEAVEFESSALSKELDDAGISEHSSDKEIRDYLEARGDFDGESFMQGVRGSFSAMTGLIKIAKDGDATTYLHEFTHAFIFAIEDAIKNGNATDQWVENYKVLREWSGAKEGALSDASINREANEMIVSGMERFFAEGVAPLPQLNGMFSRIKKMFMDIYGTLKSVGVPINSKIRNVYDQMFASYEDVQMAKKANKNFIMKRPEGVSQEFYDAFLTDHAKGDANSSTRWFNELERRVEKSKSAKIKEFSEKARVKAEEEVSKNPVYVAIDHLSKYKIHPDTLSKDNAKILPKKYKSKDGVDADITASQLGYKNASEMVRDISRAPSKDSVIAFMVEEDVREKLLSEKGIETPFTAIADKAYFDAKVKQAIMLGGRDEAEFALLKSEILENGTDAFGNSEVKNAVRQEKWRIALQRQGERAINAFNNGKPEDAYRRGKQAAQAQLQLNLSNKARKKFEKFNSLIKTINGSIPVRKRLGQANHDMLVAVLQKYSATKQTISNEMDFGDRLDGFIDRMKVAGIAEAEDLNVIKGAIEDGGDLATMTYNDFESLNRLVYVMHNWSRMSQVLSKDGELESVDEVIEDILSVDIPNKILTGKHGLANDLRKAQMGALVQPIIMEKLMGNKFARKYLFPLLSAVVARDAMSRDLMERTGDILAKYKIDNKGDSVYVEGVGELTEENLLLLAHYFVSDKNNMENAFKELALASNNRSKDSVLTGKQRADVMEAIPSRYYDAANEVVHTIYVPLYGAMNKATINVHGYGIGKVKGDSFTSPHGKTYKGGYFPEIKNIRTIDGDISTASSLKKPPSNKMSVIKERTGNVSGDVDLSMRHILRSYYMISNTIEVSEAYANFSKVFNRDGRLKHHLGEYTFNEFMDWGDSILRYEPPGKFMKFFDNSFKVSILGAKASTVIVQFYGIFVSINNVGAKWVIPEIGKLLSNPEDIAKAVKFISSKSPDMKSRYSTPNASLYGMMSSDTILKTELTKIRGKYTDAVMSGIKWADALVSAPTWMGQYNKSISEGLSEKEAVMEADFAVKKSQGDFSTAFKPKYFGSLLGFLSPFVSFFVAQLSSIMASNMTGKNKEAARLLLVVTVLTPFVEAMTEEFIASFDDDYDEDESYWENVMKRTVANIGQTFGILAFPFAGIGSSIFGDLARGAVGEREYGSQTPPAIEVPYRAVEGAKDAGLLLKNLMFDDDLSDDEVRKLQKGAVTGVSVLTGMPTKTMVDFAFENNK